MSYLQKVPVKLSIITFISLVILLVAYWYHQRQVNDLLTRIELTHESLLQIEESAFVNPKTKIAIGFGSCVDVIAQTRDVLLDRYPPPKEVKHHDIIDTRDELLQVFAYFFQYGAAAEYVSSSCASSFRSVEFTFISNRIKTFLLVS